ncbi:hypothetical protein BGX38DRAFT_1332112 [Terfezia claveryi]|nr:hypothetical protein BGX38DRAFT_1332112 [Terfezia claveryi]
MRVSGSHETCPFSLLYERRRLKSQMSRQADILHRSKTTIRYGPKPKSLAQSESSLLSSRNLYSSRRNTSIASMSAFYVSRLTRLLSPIVHSPWSSRFSPRSAHRRYTVASPYSTERNCVHVYNVSIDSADHRTSRRSYWPARMSTSRVNLNPDFPTIINETIIMLDRILALPDHRGDVMPLQAQIVDLNRQLSELPAIGNEQATMQAKALREAREKIENFEEVVTNLRTQLDEMRSINATLARLRPGAGAHSEKILNPEKFTELSPPRQTQTTAVAPPPTVVPPAAAVELGVAADLESFDNGFKLELIRQNLPLYYGGFVKGEPDEEYEYVDPENSEGISNYGMGKRLYTGLATRLEGDAKKWWEDNDSKGDSDGPNCWRRHTDMKRPIPDGSRNIEEVSLYELLKKQFSGEVDARAAEIELGKYHWDPFMDGPH